MKQKLLKTLLLLSALVVGFGNAWADTDYVINTTNFTTLTTGSGYTPYNGTHNIDGVSIVSNQVMVQSSKLQFQKTNGYLYNSTEMPGDITKITLDTPSGLKIYVGTTSNPTTTEVTSGSTISGSYKYFRVQQNSATGTAVKITVTYSSFTITAVSNNDSYGTVSGTTTITAAPEAGYRVANGSDGYTVTSGTASVSHEGYSNTLTVTPSSNCTVRVNFEAIPTHTITCVADPVGAGTFDAASSLYEGGTTSVKATANSGYKFKSWSVSGTGASISSTTDNPTTLTMGTANVTLTANFDAVTTHAITYSVNGNETIVNVPEGDAIDFSAPASGVPTGYAFKGWRTAALALTETDPNDYVTSGTSTTNITYYAVMAVENPGTASWTLDYENESSLSSSTDWGSYGTAYEYTATDGSKWTVKAYKSSGMQINTGKNSSIKVPSCSGNIQSIAITCSAAKAVGFSASDYTGSGTITYIAQGTDATSQTLDLSGESKTVGYIVPKSGSTSITKIVVTYYKPTFSGYCTTIPPVSVTVGTDSYATFASNFPLDFTGSDIKAYIAKGKADYSGVTFTQINKVPANTGVLLYYDGGTTDDIPVFAGAADATTGNVFVRGTGATVASEDGDLHNYILNKVGGVVGFYKANDKTVATNRAYIQIDESKSYSVKEFIALPGFDDDADGISLTPALSEGEGEIYNLAGQRISKMQKGINIVNGKKVLK